MAVEIPVYVDIKGAFTRAAAEIPKEMPKLEKAISSQALKVDFGGPSLRAWLTDTRATASDLKDVLKRIRAEFDAVNSGAQKARKGMNLDNLIKSYALVEQRLTGTFNQATVNIMKTEAAIGKVTQKIQKLQATLAKQTRGSDAFLKTNYELGLQQKRLAALNNQLILYRSGIDSVNDSLTRQSGIARQLTGYFSGLYAVHTLIRFVKQVRDVTGELEYQRVALGHLLGDMNFGNELFAKTIEAAKESPFRIGQLVTYTKQLAAYRIEQEHLFDTTQRLADISAGLGVDMNRLILAYGQVRAASVLRGQELRQFTEAGIPLVELLAEKFRKLGREGTTTADVFKLISERAVPFEYIKEIFEDLTNAGGEFYKMQETQAKTLKGRWEKLKDTYDQALMSLGDSSTFQSWNDTVLSILNWLAKHLKEIVRLVNAGSIGWVTYKIATSNAAKATAGFVVAAGKAMRAQTKLFGTTGMLSNGLVILRKQWNRFTVALSRNWVGLALTALATLATYFFTFRNNAKDAKDELSDMEKAIDRMKNANKEFEFQKGLISDFKSLSEITGRTEAQSRRLASAVEELKMAYPELADKIGATNVPLAKQVKLLGDAADKAHQAAIDKAKDQLNTQQELIRGYRDERDAAKQAMDIAQERLRTAQYIEAHPTVGGGSPEQLKQRVQEAARIAKQAEEAYESAEEVLAKALKDERELRKLAFPQQVIDSLDEWQKLLIKASKYTSEGLPKLLFTEKDVQGWDTLGEAVKKLKPQFEEARKTYMGLVSAVKEGGNLVRPTLVEERDAAKDTFSAWQALDLLLGGLLSKQESHGPDKRLSNLKNNINEITNAYKKFLELRKYMSEQKALDEIGILFPQLKGFKPTYENTIAKIKGLLNDYKGPKDKVYLEMQRAIDTEVSNLSFDHLKKTIDDKLKEVSDEIKRSETAQNFYRNILDITGNKELATSLSVSIYGNVGEDFKKRIKKQLADSLTSLDAESFAGLDDAVRDAFDKGDYEYLMKNLQKVPENLRDTVKRVASDAEKYNSDLANNFANLVAKYGDSAQKIATITAKAANEIKKVEDARDLALKDKKLTPDQVKAIKDRAAEIIKALMAQRDLDIFKAGDDYIKFFAEINVMTAEQATSVRTELRKAYLKAFHDGALSADELRKNLRAVDAQFRKLTEDTGLLGAYLTGGFDKANEKLMEYSDNIAVLAEKMKAGKALDSDEQSFATKMLKQFGSSEGLKGIKSYTQLIENKGGLEAAGEAFGQMGEGMASMAANGPGALAIVDAIFKAVHATISGIQQIIDQVNELRSEENKIGGWFKYLSDFDKYTFSGWEKLKSGDAIGATVDAISSWISIFNNVQRDLIDKYNDQIKEQSRLLEDLEYSYSRLNVAIEKAFGSDYIQAFNQQMQILEAEAEAYQKQADAERRKGKSADSDAIRQYERSAQEVRDRIADANSQLSEYFAGTDLTSAARDFAESWIEAYKEFGSTTDALSQKFEDMIQNMIVNSMAARVVQEQLKPIFEMIDTLAKDDGQLSIMDAAMIANKTKETVGTLNTGLTNLMNALGGAGINIRQMGTGLTGIARDIQGASEESILGLAAGVNTQNYYMQHIDINVQAILAALTGTAQTGTPATGAVVSNPYQEQMLAYVGSLPQMQGDLAAIRTMLNNVIKVKGTPATHYVATQ